MELPHKSFASCSAFLSLFSLCALGLNAARSHESTNQNVDEVVRTVNAMRRTETARTLPPLTSIGNGSIDNSFNPRVTTHGVIQCMILQPDGKILIGGSFVETNSQPRTNIARLNADGTTDTSFNAGLGPDFTVFTIRMQSDGKILIGGEFSTVDGVARNGLARLNSDGSVDTSFSPAISANATQVYAVAIQPDGKFLIGGTFFTSTGNNVVRLNSDGSLDNSFNPGTSIFFASLHVITLQLDGKILVAGDGGPINGPKPGVLRLNANGSLDSSFNPGSGADGLNVRAVSLQPDGKIVIGGNFTTFNGTTRNSIARLTANGSLDSTFDPGTGLDPNYFVFGLVIQSDGKIVLVGFFFNLNGVRRNSIARVNSNGSLDSSFNTGTGITWIQDSGSIGSAYSIALQSDGRFIIGGEFTGFNGTPRNSTARINSNGALDTSFVPEPANAGTVYSAAVQSDGKIVIGGDFSAVNGIRRNSVARINSDGSLDTSFNPGAGPVGIGSGAPIIAVVLQTDGKILLGGQFSQFSGMSFNGVVRLNTNGSIDASFTPAYKNVGNALVIRPNGKIIIGGSFVVAQLNPDGSIDPSFNVTVDFSVMSLALQTDGKLLVGGFFSTVNGTTVSNIARLNADSSVDTSFIGSADQPVNGITLQADGKIIMVGPNNIVNAATPRCIARLNSNGSLDSSFNMIMSFGQMYASAVTVDNKIVMGGRFRTVDNERIDLATVNSDGTFYAPLNVAVDINDPSMGQYFNFPLSVGYSVQTVKIQSDGNVIVAGNFTTVNHATHISVARIIKGQEATPTPTPTPSPSPSPTPTASPIELILDSSGPEANQLAALDSVLFIRDPFVVLNSGNLFTPINDRNTRLVIFATNLQLAQGETAAAVLINLVDANNQTYDVVAEDVRPISNSNFTQVVFRLPNNLSSGSCTIKLRAHGQTTNTGIIRIRI